MCIGCCLQAPDGSPPDVWCRLPWKVLEALLEITKAPDDSFEYHEDDEQLEFAPYVAMAAATHTQFVQKQHQQELAAVAARCAQQEQELAAVTARCAQQEQELAALKAVVQAQQQQLQQQPHPQELAEMRAAMAAQL